LTSNPTPTVLIVQDPETGGGTSRLVRAAIASDPDAYLVYLKGRNLGPNVPRRGIRRMFTPSIGARGVSWTPVLPQTVLLPHLVQWATAAPVLRRARNSRVVVAGASAHHAWPFVLRGIRPHATWIATTVASEYEWRTGPSQHRRSRMKATMLSRLLSMMEEVVLRASGTVYVTSTTTAADVSRRYGIRATVLPVPVDSEHFQLARSGRRHSSQELRLLFLGRPNDPRKGFDLALATLRVVQQTVPARLLVVSDSVASLDLPADCVRVDAADDRELLRRFHEADVLLMPSRQEGFGLAAVEALLSGLPTVATAFGGVEELLRRIPICEVIDAPDPDRLALAAMTLGRSPQERTDLEKTRQLISAFFKERLRPGALFVGD
jgi:glycosyltransferase involved in cell wall biosynthesis